MSLQQGALSFAMPGYSLTTFNMPSSATRPTKQSRVQIDVATRVYQVFTKFCAALVTGGAITAFFNPILGLGVILSALSIFLLGTILFLIAKRSKEGCKTALKSFVGMIFAPFYLIQSLVQSFKKEPLKVAEDYRYFDEPLHESWYLELPETSQ